MIKACSWEDEDKGLGTLGGKNEAIWGGRPGGKLADVGGINPNGLNGGWGGGGLAGVGGKKWWAGFCVGGALEGADGDAIDGDDTDEAAAKRAAML